MATILRTEKHFCCNCMKLNEYEVVSESDNSGLCDLDSRPAPPKRYTLNNSIHYCSGCGYANFQIDDLIFGLDTKQVLTSKEYTTLLQYKIDEDAKKFLLAAYLYETAKDYPTAAYLYLNSAWQLDDANDNTNAIIIRKRALVNFLKCEQNIDTLIIETDILRRISEFKEAIKLAKTTIKLSDISDSQLASMKKEISLCRRRNTRAEKEPQ